MGNRERQSLFERTRQKHESSIGRQLGRLTVLSVEHRRMGSKDRSAWYFICECACGRSHAVATCNAQTVQSCGCYREDSQAKRRGDKGIDPGDQSDRLVVLELVQGRTKSGKSVRMVSCRCDCGNSAMVREDDFISGSIRSCGCLRRELAKTRTRTHGQYGTPLYHLWQAVKDRVSKNSPNYRGRGIGMFREWFDSFALFSEYIETNLGPKPTTQHSLDRIDVDRGYEPGNVRWASPAEQARNRTTNRWITAAGQTRLLVDWATDIGVTPQTIVQRIDKLGWSPVRAVTTPSRLATRKSP